MMSSMNLGERIRAKRTELGWTQDVLAQKANISKTFLSDLENGKRGAGADTLLDIARVFGVSIDFLMTGADGDAPVPTQIEIPRPLAELAEAEGLTFRQTMAMLEMQRQIVAHRSSTKKDGPEGFDWRKFYQSVRAFL